jgi:diaminopimelate epimerase
VKFTKMHGIGNDYVYVNCFKESIKNPSELSKFLSHRHFGIGSDGLILICPSEKCDFKMVMFNADGSEGKMCGNGIRCVGKYVYDYALTDKTEITVETLSGIKNLTLFVENNKVYYVRVDMGEPILTPKSIPLDSDKDLYINEPINIDNTIYNITAVSMGNPHAVTYVDDVMNFPLHIEGPKFESNELFPERVNTEFVQIIDRTHLKMRVWERGSGETYACGTGSCATLVSSVLNNLSERKVTIHLLGGDLNIEWNEQDNHIYMTGPATVVFDGEIDILSLNLS